MPKIEVLGEISVLDDGRGRFSRTITQGTYEIERLDSGWHAIWQPKQFRVHVKDAELQGWRQDGLVRDRDDG